MNDQLRKYLLSLNCKIINPIRRSLHDNTTVGWYCKSSSILRKDEHLAMIKKFISENDISYYISNSADSREEFSIYIDK